MAGPLDRRHLALFGAPGSGKGTQADLLKTQFGLDHIATGEMLRAQRASGTDLGKMVSSFLEAGKLVPDEIILAMIRQRIQEPSADAGFVLDGFPRTVGQARALQELLAGLDRQLECCVVLEVPEAQVLARLAVRAGQEHRSDDLPEVIAKRLEIYREETEPVLEFLADSVPIVRLDGTPPVAEVSAALVRAVS